LLVGRRGPGADRLRGGLELACKLVKAGYSPMEVPVNYVARGFAEGKKINMLTDSTTSYRAFYRFRFKD